MKEQYERIIAQCKSGRTYTSIASEENMTRQRVHQIYQKYDNKSYTKRQQEYRQKYLRIGKQATAMYNKGVPYTTVAKSLGVSCDFVAKTLGIRNE